MVLDVQQRRRGGARSSRFDDRLEPRTQRHHRVNGAESAQHGPYQNIPPMVSSIRNARQTTDDAPAKARRDQQRFQQSPAFRGTEAIVDETLQNKTQQKKIE